MASELKMCISIAVVPQQTIIVAFGKSVVCLVLLAMCISNQMSSKTSKEFKTAARCIYRKV